jgi:multidrug efflux pump
MRTIIDAAFSRTRTTMLILLGIVVAGAINYISIPREAEPAIALPVVIVSVFHEGVSPGDAERLILRPLQNELQSLEGIEEMRGEAKENSVLVVLEFDPGFDAKQALNEVRERVDMARAKLPQESEEPIVSELNMAMMPVISITLSGGSEITLVRVSQDLRDTLKALPDVVDVTIGGEREEVVDIIIDPVVMETYNVSYDELLSLVQRNNRLIAAGSLDTGAGRLMLKVPGVIEELDDVLNLPIKAVGDKVVTVADVATVVPTFKDPSGFARVDGQPTLTLEVSKREGANIIDTSRRVREAVDRERDTWPQGVEAAYLMDKSEHITRTASNLENSIMTAVLLVVSLIFLVMGLRPAILVGLAVPGSYVTGILIVALLGYTMNFMTMFGLIISAGMLVDGAIVVAELAQRYLKAGYDPRTAYASAAKRMAWPIISSTATTLAVFLPLVVFPGMMGQFIVLLPITVSACLAASLLMALIFVPVLGGLVSRRHADATPVEALPAGADADARIVEVLSVETPGPATAVYARLLERLLKRPVLVLAGGFGVLIGSFVLYGMLGKGLDFFPEREPDFANISVYARGDLSVWERDDLVRRVEERIYTIEGVVSVYGRSMAGGGSGFFQNMPDDVVGTIRVEFDEWYERRRAVPILRDIRTAVADIPGIKIDAREQHDGMGQEKPIILQVSSTNPEVLDITFARAREIMDASPGLVGIEDNFPLPGNEWRLIVDRTEAARYGADITTLGSAVQLVSNGIKVAEYRPDDATDEVDIRIRFPAADRTIDHFDQIAVVTPMGSVPISNFVTWEPAPRTSVIRHADGKRTYQIKADLEPGILVDQKVAELQAEFAEAGLDPRANVQFRGEFEDQAAAAGFLGQAALASFLLMTIILVTQFNSLYQTVMVMTSVIFSTSGVLLGLILLDRPFSVVMSGIGLIALAGIVVNNNIILIDTYNTMRRAGVEATKAALQTGIQRLRPVVLTSVTTVVGVLPMVLGVNLNFAGRSIALGDPSVEFWSMISSTIAGGLTFATVLTLILTPCMLVIGERAGVRVRSTRNKIGSRISSAFAGTA